MSMVDRWESRWYQSAIVIRASAPLLQMLGRDALVRARADTLPPPGLAKLSGSLQASKKKQ